jgi:hypothetical protein
LVVQKSRAGTNRRNGSPAVANLDACFKGNAGDDFKTPSQSVPLRASDEVVKYIF